MSIPELVKFRWPAGHSPQEVLLELADYVGEIRDIVVVVRLAHTETGYTNYLTRSSSMPLHEALGLLEYAKGIVQAEKVE